MPSSLLRRTPFGLVSLVVSSFPGPGSCPRDASLRPKSTGSASALPFSKLAQRSLSLRPDHSLSCSHSPFLQCLIDFVSSINPPGGSGWSVSSRVGFLISLPLEIHGFSRHTDFCGLAANFCFLFLLLFLHLFFGSGHHLGVGIVVHQACIPAPRDHGFEYFLGVLVGQSSRDIFHYRFAIDFLLDLQVPENDVEQAEFLNLFREDLLARVTVGIDELLAQLGKAHLVFRRIDELENLRSFDE